MCAECVQNILIVNIILYEFFNFNNISSVNNLLGYLCRAGRV